LVAADAGAALGGTAVAGLLIGAIWRCIPIDLPPPIRAASALPIAMIRPMDSAIANRAIFFIGFKGVSVVFLIRPA
jgi:hypothetical protein